MGAAALIWAKQATLMKLESERKPLQERLVWGAAHREEGRDD